MNEISTNYGGCHCIHYPVKFKRMIRYYIASFLFLIMCASSFAQSSNKITGVVFDEKGLPLPGVSIILKGSTFGTVTNVEGKFTISATADQTLVFSFIGYNTQEVAINDQKVLNITLTPKVTVMNEVVVVGYGTQKRVAVTSAISSINNAEIITTKNENVQNMLTGKVAGLRVVQNSSEPGSFSNSFNIRGLGNPLVIIDGIPRDNISRIDPNDIESVSVLKDGAAAVYGVRAANGVVLITTKRGKKGSIELTYSGNFGFQVPSGLPKSVDAIGFMTLNNELSMHNVNGGHLFYLPADFAAYTSGAKKSTDWFTPVIKSQVPQSQHNLSASGGSENTNYFISLGATNQDGFLRSGDLNYHKYNLRSNITSKITKDLTVDLNINATMDQKNQPYQDAWWIIRSFWRQVPTQSIYANNNPVYLNNGQVDGTNPIALADKNVDGYKIFNNYWFQSSMALTYKIPFVSGLSAKGMFSYDFSMSDNKIYQKSYNQYNFDANSNTYNAFPNQTPSTVLRAFYERPSTLAQLSLNYDHSFKGGHNISALLLYEESEHKGDDFFAQREISLPVDQLLAGNSLNQQGAIDAGGLFDNSNKGIVGRINYDYQSKYLAEISFREDGSSKFASNKQWGFFPSASLGWRVSQEKFWKNILALSFINDLKFRASYGKLGDDAASTYQFITGYIYPANGSSNQLPGGSVFNETFINAVQNKGIANPNLTWYTSKTYNAGVDLEAWKGLLGVTFDVFKRDRSGLLASQILSLPSVVGAALPQVNLNSDRTQGFDMEVTHKNHIGSFNYYIKGTLAYTRTQNIQIARAADGNSQINWTNNPNNRYNNILWGYGSAGQYQSYNAILNSPTFVGRGTVVGDYAYQDWNGDGQINGQDVHPLTYSGDPLITYGTTIGGSFKGFDANILLQGSGDVDVSYFEQLNTPLWGGGSALVQFLDRWHPTDPSADPYSPSTVWTPGHFAYTGSVPQTNSNFNIQNGAYLRLKSLEIGYTLPAKIASKIGIKGARIYANGYNIFTITKLKYVDPEHPSSTYGYIYPLNKEYSIGVNVKL